MNILWICPTFSKPTCGIGAYTQNLAAAIKPLGHTQSIVEGFTSIRHVLSQLRPDVCHIQLEYSFCSAERLALVDEYCTEFRTRLFATYHTLACVPHNVAGTNITRLAHTPLASRYGEFTVIPSGIPIKAPENPAGKLGTQDRLFLETRPYLFFGQAHPHKQLLELLQLFRETPGMELLCVVSKPIAGDTSYYDTCCQLAKTLRNVCWISEFLTDGEILWLTNFCSAAVLPYAEYGSIGVSAAVKLLLNNRTLPICTSRASHFSDLPDDNTVVSRINNLSEVLNFKLHQPAARTAWVEEHSFAVVALQHLELYAGK